MSMRKPYDRGQFPQKNKTEAEIRLAPKFDTEEASKSGHNLWKRRRLFDKGTKVGTSFETSKIYDARFYDKKLFHIINLDASATLTYQIWACTDPEKWHQLTPTTDPTVSAGEEAYETSYEPFAFYKVLAKGSASCSLAVYAGAQK